VNASQAFALLRARLEGGNVIDAQSNPIALLWQHETNEIPDAQAPFVYSEMVANRGQIASFGGGRGQNRYRNPAEFICFVFVPVGQGVAVALGYGEQVASLFRSHRDGDLSCFDASVMPEGEGADLVPPGLSMQAGNYACAAVSVSLFFDTIG
jgi:hypothetical protein